MTEDAARPPRPWAAAQDAPPPPPPGAAPTHGPIPPTGAGASFAGPPPGGYAPPPGGYLPPPGGYAPPPGAAGFTTRYGLVRPRQGRYLAGVCAAIGRATNTDPVLWRVLLAVLGFFGGIGVIVYVAGWLIIPGEGDTASPVEAMLGRGRSSMSPITVIVLGIVVAVGFAYVVTDGFRAILLGAVILVCGALLLNREQPGSPRQPDAFTPPAPPGAWPTPPAGAGDPTVGPASAAHQPVKVGSPVRPAGWPVSPGPSTLDPFGDPPAGDPPAGDPLAGHPEPGHPSEPAHSPTPGGEPDRPPVAEPDRTVPVAPVGFPALPAPGWPAAAGTRPSGSEPVTAAMPAPVAPVDGRVAWPAPPAIGAPLDEPAAVPPPTPVGTPLLPGGYRPPFAPHGPYAGSPPPPDRPARPPRPPKRPKERSPLGAITFSLIFLALGLVAMVDLLDVFPVGAAGYFAAVLATIGLGLLVGTWFGRARWLIALGLVTAAALGIATVAESYDRVRGVDGDVTWAPTDLRDLATRYENNIGDAVLDLRAINFDGQEIQVTVDVNLGNATVVVPPNVDVTTVADGNAREISVFGKRSGGFGGRPYESTDTGADGPGGGKLRLYVHVNAGDLEVTR
ncbi:PspC domain-containing protein [Micromonospora sp. DT31]|uniref:PspC domain-containing protein n=1 Tax=Micromonospora sp. DT31 TaxID=3393434 RepID=UPI003CF11776